MNVKLSSPLKLADGVYVANEPSTVTLPLLASVPNVKLRLSPSISSPVKVITTLPSSATVPEAALAVGASLTGATVTLNACDAENSPSVTVAVNVSLPLKS